MPFQFFFKLATDFSFSTFESSSKQVPTTTVKKYSPWSYWNEKHKAEGANTLGSSRRKDTVPWTIHQSS